MTLPYALGCPSCDHHEIVSAEDPDATLSELAAHMARAHNNRDWVASPWCLAGVALELTAEDAAR